MFILEWMGILGFSIFLYQYRNAILTRLNQWNNYIQSFLFQKIETKATSQLYLSGNKENPSEWFYKQLNTCKVVGIISLFLFILFQKTIWLGIPILFILSRLYFLVLASRKRTEEMTKRLPFVLDMLVLNLQSGLDFISSLEEMAGMDFEHPLHQEIQRTMNDIHVGSSRYEAFVKMAQRNNMIELQNLAATIGQSESLGSSLTELLRLQSQELRHRIFKRAESQAQKAPVKILIPMLGFIFPVIFILLFVPIGIQLLKYF